jgi:hypothetical protein
MVGCIVLFLQCFYFRDLGAHLNIKKGYVEKHTTVAQNQGHGGGVISLIYFLLKEKQ